MPIIIYSGKARRDLVDIWLWLAEQNGGKTADKLIERIERRISLLATHPQAGPARHDITPDARVLLAERWLVLYQIDAETVRIVRIVDGVIDLRRVEWDE